MEGRGRSRRRNVRRQWEQRLGSAMALIITISMVLNTPLSWNRHMGISSVYASAGNARRKDAVWATANNAKYKQGSENAVDIYVVADDNEVVPGNTASMTLYLKNNTGEVITDGVLTFKGKRIGQEDGWFSGVTEDGLEMPDTVRGSIPAEQRESSGEGLLYREAEDQAEEGPGDQDDSRNQDNRADDDRMNDNEESEENRLTDMELLPGQIYQVSFEFYTEEDLKSQSAYVRFRFAGEGSEGAVKGETKFYYSIGLPVVNVDLGGGSAVEAGIEHEMNIWMTEPDWVDQHLEAVLEKQKEQEETAKPASGGNAKKETGSAKADRATPSDGKTASGSNAAGSRGLGQTLLSAQEAARIEAYAEKAIKIQESRVSYTVEIWGTRYQRFEPKKAEEAEDIGWISCLYQLARDQEPGVYYGKVTAKGKWNRKSFISEQGFLFQVSGEHVSPAYQAEARLEQVAVYVSVKEGVLPEGARLAVKELKAEGETADQFREAAEALNAEGMKYSGMMALDIAFLDADGNVIEPNGDVGAVQVSMEMNSAILPEGADLGSVAVQHLEENEEGIQVQTVAAAADTAGGTIEVKQAKEVIEAAFEVDRFSVFAVTWMDRYGQNDTPGGTVEAKVYLRYSNELPAIINGDDEAAGYGPSGNNTPYITVTVDLDQVNQKSDCYRKNYDYYTTWYYYSIESDDRYVNGSKESALLYWNQVIYPAIEEDDRTELDRIFGGEGKYIGYVLKKENDGWHIDGVLADDPPNYVVELYDDSASGKPCLFAISDNDRNRPGVSYQTFKNQLETTLGGTNYRYVTEQTDRILVEYQKDGCTYQTEITPRNWYSHIYPSYHRFGYQTITQNIYYLCQLKMETSMISGNLTISKEVTGSAKNLNEHFRFTLTGTGMDGAYEAVYAGTDSSCGVQHNDTVQFTNGQAELDLKHGESVQIKNLPLNQRIQIEEQPGDYTSQVEVTAGGKTVSASAVEIVIDGTGQTAAFKNTQTIPVPTGLFQGRNPYFLMLALAVIGIMGFGCFSYSKKIRRAPR